MDRRSISVGQCLTGLALVVLCALVAGLPAAAKEPRPYGQGRLFLVSAAAVDPSYVYGTMHSTDPDVLKLPTPVARAFGKSARLVLELVFTPDLEARMQAAMRLTDGRSLPEIVGPALFSRLLQRATVYRFPAAQLKTLKPWAAGLVFSLPLDELDRSAAGALALDRALQKVADERGIPVYGLETMDEQIAAFSGFSMEDQIAALRMTIELNPRLDALFTEMKGAYLAGNLDHLHTMMRSMYAGKHATLADLFERRLIVLRNRRMADRMMRYVKSGSAFVAVGALHLSGENGILRLLEMRGYKIERAY